MKKVFFIFLTFIFTACVDSNPSSKSLQVSSPEGLKSILKPYPSHRIKAQNIENKTLAFPKIGELNSYELLVDDDLELAYQNYLGGDGQKALDALNRIAKSSKDNKMLWQVSMLKMKIYIMMGLGESAIEEASTCEKYEELSFGWNLNCEAQKGESYVWAGDFKNAKQALFSTLLKIGNWELPTSYLLPPSNMPKLVSKTTAQLRSYTALSAIYTLQDNYKEAYYFAHEADKRYNALLYVSNHWLYGKFLKLHLDTYYGYATNLTFLASAQLSKSLIDKSNQNFKKSMDFFDKIGYQKGKSTVLTLKSRTLNQMGKYNQANKVAKLALDEATKNGFLDLIWRIEALRGESYAKMGDDKKAQLSYRKALKGINSLSTMLISDSSKRRFGFNKDDLAIALMKYDIKNRDYEQLFIDAEENRARAFIDTLSKRILKREDPLLKEIYKYDNEINRQSLLNMTMAKENSKGVERLEKLIALKKERELALKESNPRLSSVVSVWSSSIKELQKNLNNNTLLYFLPNDYDKKIDYLLISSNNYSLHTLDITYDQLKRKIKTISETLGINSIQNRAVKTVFRTKDIPNPKSIEKNIAELSQLLNIAIDSSNLYVVASNEANFIPWGMLNIGFTPILLPTASWLNLKNIKIDSSKAVIVGNPEFGGEVSQLLGAEEEAKLVAQLYHTEAFLNSNATKLNIRKELVGGVNLLHFATHGIFYKNQPLKSAILLSDGQKVDRLSANELLANPLKANLVVLSACESGLGSSASANDYLGLSRSFFLGGTKAILSSLWAIEDEGTKEFMRVFYTFAKDGAYAKGYAKAKENLKSRGFSPAVYGAFILQGLDSN